MSSAAFFGWARWFLHRLLVALLVTLAIMVVARQFEDGDEDALGGPGASTADGPRIGDHWHASYGVFICGQKLPPFPLWGGGVHTHEDGIIHSHPTAPSEEGAGASLVRWFQYGGGELTETSLTLPGSGETFANGDACPDGSAGEVQVLVNGEALDEWLDYIPQHGDSVIVAFGPPLQLD
jgi:hypothetical protein